ncbi:MAG: N-acetylmuramoyl-L-alanine amidase [Alphaproteobacteria bacterium]|uniref:N-acetylmuramoyl-L-alanine amidase n=1 Tax=Maricaulis alexandrii TaxID=2570354 RepID=UPI0014870A96|nr:N-acetylmuramoyl-L-alanine amidase [Maricaulis alexandrii]MCR9267492.1 N-acetylmuramoyl-L-alanine amidase [Alphaproteobacteria bacterium]
MTAMLGAALLGSAGMADQEVRDVRFGVDGARTRVVIETAEAVDFRAFTLDGLSDRLVVDLPDMDWSVSGLEAGEGVGHGLVDGFRFFNNSSASSRVVFELEHPAVIVGQFALDPAEPGGNHRLVIDVERSTEDTFQTASGFSHTSAGSLDSLIMERVEAVYVPPERERRVIVVDAGHGGHDPGTIGRSGTHESDVTLEAARELRRQLEATGRYEVLLTRDRDVYPSWEQRVGVMADSRADLFISLHADSSPSANTRGAAVYTLNDRAEDRARQRGRQNNARTELAEVNHILLELELREKRNQSSAFAEVLLEHLSGSGPLLSNPHRQANLFVLLDPRVPAVLVEMGFLSNRTDESNLTSASSRRRQMASIVSGIDDYFANRGDDEFADSDTIALPAR